MSDVRPELQQILEALGLVMWHTVENGDQRLTETLAALARVEATLNAQQHHCVYPECVVGEKPELCGHCGDAERAEAAEARVVAAEAERDDWHATAIVEEEERVAAEAERDTALQSSEQWRQDYLRANDRQVAAEAERDEWKAKYEAGDGQRPSSVEPGRSVYVCHCVTGPPAHGRCAACGAPGAGWPFQGDATYITTDSTSGASGAPQDTASPAPAEPPERTEAA